MVPGSLQKTLLALMLVILSLLGSVFSQKKLGRFGDFEVAELVDPITDQKTVGAITRSREGKATLAVRCVGDRFDVVLGNTLRTLELEKEIFARFDQGLVRETWATVSFNGDSIRLKEQDSLWFYSRVKISQQFAIRIYERDGRFNTYTFGLAGFNQADRLLICAKPK